MNCQDFELQIALFVESDLPVDEIPQLEAHLAICESCRQFAEEMQESQIILKTFGKPELDEAVLAQVRHSVMRQIAHSKSVTSFWQRLWNGYGWRFALASLLLTAVMVPILVSWFKSPVKPEVSVVTAPVPVHTQEPSVQVQNPKSTDVALVVSSKSLRTRTVPLRHHLVKHHAEPPVAPAQNELSSASLVHPERDTISSEPEKTRIEIQTQDPNIRIIWFANKTSEPSVSTRVS